MLQRSIFTLTFIVTVCMFSTAVIGAMADAPNHSPDEIIIKYKQVAANEVEQELEQETNIEDVKISSSLDHLNNKYKVQEMRPLFKNFKANRAKYESLKIKDCFPSAEVAQVDCLS